MTIADKVLTEAESWIGTPYRHGASTRGISCDCLGLVRGVWHALYGEEPEDPGAYAPDWAEAASGDPLLEAANRHMQPRSSYNPEPGDLLIFRWRADVAAKHLGIMTNQNRFIHAYEGHRVMASALVPQWRKRIAGIFIFPEPKG
ncbi:MULTISPECIES: C40 family peptidase [Ochrobactrum]|uniref:NlpC/P60 family protein n=1 Tax=Ochrobactrum chromiisoli TaxID=2993941 RepID=A0ABT3QK65_9HYPH|nr:NlpC/P60 family protein [Ochrobactrum chromiisoli]MCX2695999.1 NlpC/P60 family protein [Ochrobactrum chromiisoli]